MRRETVQRVPVVELSGTVRRAMNLYMGCRRAMRLAEGRESYEAALTSAAMAWAAYRNEVESHAYLAQLGIVRARRAA